MKRLEYSMFFIPILVVLIFLVFPTVSQSQDVDDPTLDREAVAVIVSVVVDGAKAAEDSDEDGSNGGEIDIQTGVNVDLGDGSGIFDGAGQPSGADQKKDITGLETLGEGEYFLRQVAPGELPEEPVITVSGNVVIHTQFIFNGTIRGDFSNGTPCVTIYAGQTLWVEPPADWANMLSPNPESPETEVLRYPHRLVVDMTPPEGSSYSGGSVTFCTTQTGDVACMKLSACGGDGDKTGSGGHGGTIKVLATNSKVLPYGGPGPIRVKGGHAGRRFSIINFSDDKRGPGEEGANGGIGGDGGSVAIRAAELDSDLPINCRGGDGGTGQYGRRGQDGQDKDPTGAVGIIEIGGEGGAGGKGGNGGDGGDGGYVRIILDGTVEPEACAIVRGGDGGTAGEGGDGGTGGSPGGKGGKGGDGGDGGNAGAMGILDGASNKCLEQARSLFLEFGVIHEDFKGGNGGAGGAGGHGGTGGDSYGQMRGGQGGDGGLGGRGGDCCPPYSEPGDGGALGQGGIGGGTNESLGKNGLPGDTMGPGDEIARMTNVQPIEPDEPDEDTWTIMVYIAADENPEIEWHWTKWPTYKTSEDELIGHLNAMEHVNLSGSGINLLVLLDRNPGYNPGESGVPSYAYWGMWHDTRRGWVTYDGDKDNISTVLVPVDPDTESELNTGDRRTLLDFISWARQVAPAQHYMLVIDGHGGGWYGQGHDEDESTSTILWADGTKLSDRLMMSELRDVFTQTKFDIVASTTCISANIEAATELMGTVGYYIGTPNIMHWSLFYSDQWLIELADKDLEGNYVDPKSLAISIVEAWHDPISSLSCVDLTRLSKLLESLKNFTDYAISTPSAAQGIKDIAASCVDFEFDIKDIDNFAVHMLDDEYLDPAVVNHAASIRKALRKAVLKNKPNPSDIWFGGLCVYLPADGSVDKGYHKTETGEERFTLTFAEQTRWDEFLRVMNAQ